MLKEFREFYGSLEIDPEKIDDSTLICFDANVLLHIYRYSDKTRKKLFEAISKVKNNIFVPYHASLEFNLNKKEVLYESLNEQEKIVQSILKKADSFTLDINNLLDGTNIKSNDEKPIREKIKSKFKKDHKEFIDNWIKDELSKEFGLIKDLSESDLVSNELAKLLNGKVGKSYDQKKINEIQKEGEIRYSNKIPPGYEDDKNSKKQDTVHYSKINYVRKYGDLIIWNQIIDKVLEVKKDNINNQIDKVIFVTDDFKEDWVYELKGQVKGVRAELRKEMLDRTDAYLHIKNTNGFLKLVLDIEEELIRDEDILDSTLKESEKMKLSRLIKNQRKIDEINKIHSLWRFDNSNCLISNDKSNEEYKFYSNIFLLREELDEISKRIDIFNGEVEHLRIVKNTFLSSNLKGEFNPEEHIAKNRIAASKVRSALLKDIDLFLIKIDHFEKELLSLDFLNLDITNEISELKNLALRFHRNVYDTNLSKLL